MKKENRFTYIESDSIVEAVELHISGMNSEGYNLVSVTNDLSCGISFFNFFWEKEIEND